jgi:hypothetical protein
VFSEVVLELGLPLLMHALAYYLFSDTGGMLAELCSAIPGQVSIQTSAIKWNSVYSKNLETIPHDVSLGEPKSGNPLTQVNKPKNLYGSFHLHTYHRLSACDLVLLRRFPRSPEVQKQ